MFGSLFRRLALGVAAAALAGTALSQAGEFVTDELVYDSRAETVELLGAVEVKTEAGYFYADYLHYDLNTERFTVQGQLHIVASDGTLVIADYGTLDTPTQQLVLRAAKAMLVNRFQLASTYYRRTEAYDYGEGVVASSCTVCRLDPVPLWALRAEQLYLDNENHKIYARNGRFELAGVPLIYLPKMRFPGPGATRLEGFLTPKLIFSDRFLSGFEIPYYWVLGDYADFKLNTRLTIDPIIVSDWRYRQNFAGGNFTLDGAYLFLDQDDEVGRYFLEGTVNYALPYDFDLKARYTLASDYDFQPDFNLARYHRDDLVINRYRNDSAARFEIARYRPSTEAGLARNRQSLLPYAQYQQRFDLGAGWAFDWRTSALILRQSKADDLRQLISSAKLVRTDLLPLGLISEVQFGADLRLSDRTAYLPGDSDQSAALVRPFAILNLSWPLLRQGTYGQHRLTPRLGLSTSESFGVDALDYDSLKFAGADDYIGLFSGDQADYGQPFENTTELRAGFDYEYQRNDGGRFEFALGRAIAFANDDGSPTADYSEWVGYANYHAADWSLTNRFGFSDALDLTRFETGFAYTAARYNFSIDWLRLIAVPDLGATSPVSELELAGTARLGDNWQITTGLDYDLENTRPYNANLTLVYGNECIELTAGAKWKFNKGEGIAPERSLSFNVEFLGLSAPTNTKWGRKQCS